MCDGVDQMDIFRGGRRNRDQAGCIPEPLSENLLSPHQTKLLKTVQPLTNPSTFSTCFRKRAPRAYTSQQKIFTGSSLDSSGAAVSEWKRKSAGSRVGDFGRTSCDSPKS